MLDKIYPHSIQAFGFSGNLKRIKLEYKNSNFVIYFNNLTKKDYIKYWRTTAEKDWKAVQSMFRSKNYVHALFFAHLVLEKLCKAYWVKEHESNHPPKIHNLIYLADNIPLDADTQQRACLEKMNAFQLEAGQPHQNLSKFSK